MDSTTTRGTHDLVLSEDHIGMDPTQSLPTNHVPLLFRHDTRTLRSRAAPRPESSFSVLKPDSRVPMHVARLVYFAPIPRASPLRVIRPACAVHLCELMPARPPSSPQTSGVVSPRASNRWRRYAREVPAHIVERGQDIILRPLPHLTWPYISPCHHLRLRLHMRRTFPPAAPL
jgi:hypothetical protein